MLLVLQIAVGYVLGVFILELLTMLSNAAGKAVGQLLAQAGAKTAAEILRRQSAENIGNSEIRNAE